MSLGVSLSLFSESASFFFAYSSYYLNLELIYMAASFSIRILFLELSDELW